MPISHLLFIFLIDLIWAVNTVALKVSVDALHPWTAAALRYAMVLVICLPWLRWVPGRMPLLLLTSLIAGAVFFSLNSLAFYYATNVSAMAVAGQLGVPFSLILAVLFDKERIHIVRIAGICLAFSGVVILTFDPQVAHEPVALFILMLSSLAWAMGSLLCRRLSGISALNIQAWMGVISVPTFVTLAFWLEPGTLTAVKDIQLPILGWVAYSAILSSVVGHVGMTWMFQRHPVSTISPLTLPTPVLAVICTILFFHEPVTWSLIAGGGLTMAGIAIIVIRTARAHETKEHAP